MPQTYTTLGTLFTAIADAIRAKKGTTGNIVADDFPTEIASIQTGGGSIIPSDLPSDGATRGGIHIPDDADAHGRTVTLMMYHNSSSTSTTVDWGDGTATSTVTGSGRKTRTHTYASTGDYIIKTTINAGTIYFGGGNSYTIYGSYNSSSTIYQRPYLQWIVLGAGVTKLGTYALYYCTGLQEIRFPASGFTEIAQYALAYCRSLKEVTIPDTVTTMGTYTFSTCTALTKAVLPTNSTLKTIPNYCFRYCYCLAEVTIPSQFTTIGQYSFDSCYSLKSVTLPSNLTTISAYGFNSCMSLCYLSIPSTVTSLEDYALGTLSCLQKLRFNGNTAPTAAAITTFNNLQTTCVISVPTGKLSAYTGATNYPSSSSYTYVEEAA